MAWLDKRDGKPTGSWVGEWSKGKKKRRFKTKREAEDYEAWCKMMNREPPTIDEGGPSSGELSYREVVALAKAAGGPRGRWTSERDPSLMQRIDFGVSVIGDLGITRVDRQALAKIRDHAAIKGRTNATRNRYVMAAHAVLSYAENEGIIPHAPKSPMLDEEETRKHRDILKVGQDDVILQEMTDAGFRIHAMCVDALIQTGLRSGELLKKLTPEQVHIEQVRDPETGQTVNVGVIQLQRGQTKNKKGRFVILSADIARNIKALIATGSMPDGYQLLDRFKQACERAGITGNLVIHSLRHTRNTRLRKAGISTKIRKELLGHMSDEANEIYDHTDIADLLAVEKKVQEYAGKVASVADEPQGQVVDFTKLGAG